MMTIGQWADTVLLLYLSLCVCVCVPCQYIGERVAPVTGDPEHHLPAGAAEDCCQ